MQIAFQFIENKIKSSVLPNAEYAESVERINQLLDAKPTTDNPDRQSNIGAKKREEVIRKEFAELFGTDEHKRMVEVADRVRKLEAIKDEDLDEHLRNVDISTMSREDKKDLYKSFQTATNKETGVEVGFFSSAFEKNHRDGGLFEKAIPKLKKAFEESILAYGEDENLEGQIRPDGTVHKEHRSIESFENYIGKVALDGKDYYVRFTVQMQKGQNGIHSQMVTNMSLYDTENPTKVASYRALSAPARLDFDEIVDTKLQKFFLMSSKTNEEFEQRLQNWQYSSSRQSNLGSLTVLSLEK